MTFKSGLLVLERHGLGKLPERQNLQKWLAEGATSLLSGLRKRVVSKRVVLAEVPLYRHFLQKIFPYGATLDERKKKPVNFDVPGPQHGVEGTFAKTALL